MPSYKIHSLKDNKKLSFIIEGKDSMEVQNRFSKEGHIILSIEEVQKKETNLFVFSGKKSDNSSIEGKISAPDIFQAYTILTNDYKYFLSSLYPEKITNPEEQKKIFLDITKTFHSPHDTVKKEAPIDSATKKLNTYKTIAEKMRQVIELTDVKDKNAWLVALKKLEQINSTLVIKNTLLSIGQHVLKENPTQITLVASLRGLLKELGVFMIPPKVSNFFSSLKGKFTIFTPLIHSELLDTPKAEKKEDFSLILHNVHINSLLVKNYNVSFINSLFKRKRNFSGYFFFRKMSTLFRLRQGINFLSQMLQKGLLLFVCLTLAYGAIGDSVMTISTNQLSFFLVVIFTSLVIRTRQV